MQPEIPDLSPQQVAEMCHVHINTVRNWMYAGTIKYKRLGARTVRIPLSEAMRMKSYTR